jgi:peptidyl-prolyl cis-trans isomerase A (cyclophilin A)
MIAGCAGSPASDATIARVDVPATAIVLLDTSSGPITLEVYLDLTPITAGNFVNLSKSGFYDGTRIHRVEGPGKYPPTGFIIQGGDPNSRGDNVSLWGYGGPGYEIKDEFPRDANGTLLLSHDAAGVLSMANNAKPDTGGSQFFITLAPAPALDGKYSVFGRVIGGLSVVQSIGNVPTDAAAHPLANVYVYRATVLDASVWT